MKMRHADMNGPWWKNAVVYQVYPRSFQDSNGDGIGDLPGLIARLDYLEKLGADCIWLSPVYRSPQEDNGYDIADFCDIEPMFGTPADMDRLILEAKKRDIRIVMDLVLNHTSDAHRWFEQAAQSRENKYHDYYIWRDGVKGAEPNDMRACFGGSAWTWVPQVESYYFHQFSDRQPDLNWENPQVRREIYDMIRWWMDKGVGGFRLDVIDQIAKEPDRGITINGPRLHEFFREMNRETFSHGELMTVGEAWGATPDRAKLYSCPDASAFSMVFQFEHIGLDQIPGGSKWDLAPLDFIRLKQVLAKWQEALYGAGWNSLFWNNHDLPRIVSRWGNDKEYRVVSAKMLATVLHGMQGTPYIYQGEELGMTNAAYPIEEYRDIEIQNLYRDRLAEGYKAEDIMASIHAKGRDNARTPMQWDAGKNAGFSDGTAWLRVNPNHTEINAEAQLQDENSVFHYYRRLIRLRKEYAILTDGKFDLLAADDPAVFAYTRTLGRQVLLVVCNFFGEPVTRPLLKPLSGKRSVLAANYPLEAEGMLRPYEAQMVLYTEQNG